MFVVPFPKDQNFSFHPYFLHHNIFFFYLDSIVDIVRNSRHRDLCTKRSKRGEFAAIQNSQNSQAILVQSTTSLNIKINQKESNSTIRKDTRSIVCLALVNRTLSDGKSATLVLQVKSRHVSIFFHLKRVQFYKTFHHFFKLKPISFSAPPPRYFSLLILILNFLHLIILSLLRTFIDYNYIYISIYNYLFLFVLWNNTYTRDKNFLPLCKNMYHFPRFTRSSTIFLYFFFLFYFLLCFFLFEKQKEQKKTRRVSTKLPELARDFD